MRNTVNNRHYWEPHRTVPSSSSLISPVHLALVCMWTIFVAEFLSLATVGVRPGARNWLAKAFSVGEDCRSNKEPFRAEKSATKDFRATSHQLLSLQESLQKIHFLDVFSQDLWCGFAE